MRDEAAGKKVRKSGAPFGYVIRGELGYDDDIGDCPRKGSEGREAQPD